MRTDQTFVDNICSIERHGNLSRNGTPSYTVVFASGRVHLTATDSAVNYVITNPEHQNVPVTVTIEQQHDKTMRIIAVAPVNDPDVIQVAIHSDNGERSYLVYTSEADAAAFLWRNGFEVLSHEPSPTAYIYGPSGETAHRGYTTGLRWSRVCGRIQAMRRLQTL